MLAPGDSPLASASPQDIAKVLLDEAMLGGPDDYGCDDPVMWVLWWELRRWMLGSCALLASHLSATRGHPVVVLEHAHETTRRWGLRHAAVTTLPEREAAALIAQGRGFEIPIIDGGGEGTLRRRMELYWTQEHDFRVTLASDQESVMARLLDDRRIIKGWDGDRREERMPDLEFIVPRLPGLALALGVPFDVREAVSAILEDDEVSSRRMAAEVEASGIAGWARAIPVPAS